MGTSPMASQATPIPEDPGVRLLGETSSEVLLDEGRGLLPNLLGLLDGDSARTPTMGRTPSSGPTPETLREPTTNAKLRMLRRSLVAP
eukprot:8608929-Pyramimonas_sp.AAC.1